MADEWFRSPSWDEAAQVEFERRLGRARFDNRTQYLRINALALAGVGEIEGARELLLRCLDVEGGAEFQRAAAMESLGDLARKQGDLEGAEVWYRRLLELSPTLNGTSYMAEVSLAEIQIARAAGQPPPEAFQLLASAIARHSSGMFNSQILRCLLVDAALAELDDDFSRRAAAAREALELVGQPAQFSRHPTVGLAEPDAETLEWLRRASVPESRVGLPPFVASAG